MIKENFKKREIIIGFCINVLLFILLSIANYNYFTVDISEYIIKTSASAIFVICGVFNFIN